MSAECLAKKVSILENVHKKITALTIIKWARDHGFVVRVISMNSSLFVPTSRSRMYAVLIDVKQVSLVQHPREWAGKLLVCAGNLPKQQVSDFMLGDSDPQVVARLDRFRIAFRKRYPTSIDFEIALKNGVGWPKSFEMHKDCRQYIQQESGVKANRTKIEIMPWGRFPSGFNKYFRGRGGTEPVAAGRQGCQNKATVFPYLCPRPSRSQNQALSYSFRCTALSRCVRPRPKGRP